MNSEDQFKDILMEEILKQCEIEIELNSIAIIEEEIVKEIKALFKEADDDTSAEHEVSKEEPNPVLTKNPDLIENSVQESNERTETNFIDVLENCCEILNESKQQKKVEHINLHVSKSDCENQQGVDEVAGEEIEGTVFSHVVSLSPVISAINEKLLRDLERQEKNKCTQCGKYFSHRSSLNEHLKIHKGVRNYKCELCNKYFTRKSTLNNHLYHHNGIKYFKCHECGKRFIRQLQLDKHLITHTGERNFKCLTCGKRFTQKSHLGIHQLVHTGIKNYKCDECGKYFARKTNLRNHSTVHTGEKRYKCNYCHKKFTRSPALKHHLLKHRSESNFRFCFYNS